MHSVCPFLPLKLSNCFGGPITFRGLGPFSEGRALFRGWAPGQSPPPEGIVSLFKSHFNKPVELHWTAFREVTQEIGNNLVFAFNAIYRSLVG